MLKETQKFDEVSLLIEMSMRYSEKRDQHFTLWDNLVTFLSIAGGSAAVLTLLDFFAIDVLGPILLAAIALLNAASLAFGIPKKRWLHHRQYRRYNALNVRVRTDPNRNDLAAQQLNLEWGRVQVDEPPQMSIVTFLAYNESFRARGINKKFRIGFVQRLFAPLVDIGATRIQEPEQIVLAHLCTKPSPVSICTR